MPTEKRREQRTRTLFAGRIEFHDGSSTLDCLVRDLSAHGAHLSLPTTFGAPDEFILYIPHDGRRLHVKVQWRDGRSLGVVFVNEDVPAV